MHVRAAAPAEAEKVPGLQATQTEEVEAPAQMRFRAGFHQIRVTGPAESRDQSSHFLSSHVAN